MSENPLTDLPWRCVVIALVCGLTLAASGDDACLLRVLVPSLPDQSLSLDDPNADFTASSDSSEILSPTPLHELAHHSLAARPPALSSATSSLHQMLDADFFGPCATATPSLRC